MSMRQRALSVLVLLSVFAGHAARAEREEIVADSPDALQHQVEAALKSWSEHQKRPVALTFAGLWPAHGFVPGKFAMSWQISAINAHTREARIMLTPLATGSATALEAKQEMRVLLNDLEEVWEVKGTLQEHQRVSCEHDLVSQWRVASASESARWRGDCAALTGLELRRPLSAGEVLLAADLREPVAVHRMSAVSATTHIGVIDLEVKAMAMGDANVGQTIKVKTSGSNQVVDAVVIGPNAVVIN